MRVLYSCLYLVLLFTFASIALSGCSLSSSENSKPEKTTSAALQDESEPPFRVEIIEERNTGKELYVYAGITPQVDRKLSDIAVRITAFRDGEFLSEVTEPLEKLLKENGVQVVGNRLERGEQVAFTGYIEAKDFTDYQLEVLWGDDQVVQMLAIENTDAIQDEALQLQNVSVQPLCVGSKCDGFVLLGELFNAGSTSVTDAELGVGVVFQSQENAKGEQLIPDDEQVLALADVMLAPMEKQPVRFEFEGPFPKRADGQFVPVARIISYTN